MKKIEICGKVEEFAASRKELEQRIADLEAKNKILEANMQVILDAIKNGKINPSGNPPNSNPI